MVIVSRERKETKAHCESLHILHLQKCENKHKATQSCTPEYIQSKFSVFLLFSQLLSESVILAKDLGV